MQHIYCESENGIISWALYEHALENEKWLVVDMNGKVRDIKKKKKKINFFRLQLDNAVHGLTGAKFLQKGYTDIIFYYGGADYMHHVK